MARIGLLTPCVIPGDAVSNDVIGMEAVLTARGHEVRVFADTWAPSPLAIRHVNEVASFLQDPASVLLYHYSVGWDVGLQMLRDLPCKTVVKYHNVTPPQFFDGINADYAAVCRHGRAQLAAIATAGCDLYLSDSEYNAREMGEAGAGTTENGSNGKAAIASPTSTHFSILRRPSWYLWLRSFRSQ